MYKNIFRGKDNAKITYPPGSPKPKHFDLILQLEVALRLQYAHSPQPPQGYTIARSPTFKSPEKIKFVYLKN